MLSDLLKTFFHFCLQILNNLKEDLIELNKNIFFFSDPNLEKVLFKYIGELLIRNQSLKFILKYFTCEIATANQQI